MILNLRHLNAAKQAFSTQHFKMQHHSLLILMEKRSYNLRKSYHSTFHGGVLAFIIKIVLMDVQDDFDWSPLIHVAKC